jgi:hypothetical protein
MMPPCALHLGHDQVCGLALVEACGPVLGNAPQHPAEVRIAPRAAPRQRLAAGQEQRGGSVEPAQQVCGTAH